MKQFKDKRFGTELSEQVIDNLDAHDSRTATVNDERASNIS